MAVMNINIELPADLQQLVRSVIERGEFQNEAEVVGEALRLFEKRQRHIERLRQELLPAAERLDRGEGIELDDGNLHEYFENLGRRHAECKGD